MNQTHDLVGQKVNLKETKRTVHEFEYIQYELDDSVMEDKIKSTFGEGVRIFTPGTMGTADWKPYRMNVHIDKHGIITRINNG
jgi:hypothetical protein